VVLLHGLFGAGGNLGALARSLQDRYSVYSPDLPGHGRSPWLARYDLPALADAVLAWLDSAGLAHVRIVGHSLGGKVAMELALRAPGRVAVLVVADIAPVQYPPGAHDAVFAALAAVAAAHCRSREEAANIMADHLDDEGTAQFLLASLRRGDAGAWDWRFDRAGLHRDYPALLAAPVAASPWPGPALFLHGGASGYVRPRNHAAIHALFPRAILREMSGCGHWLHVERPQEFNSIVADFLATPRD